MLEFLNQGQEADAQEKSSIDPSTVSSAEVNALLPVQKAMSKPKHICLRYSLYVKNGYMGVPSCPKANQDLF